MEPRAHERTVGRTLHGPEIMTENHDYRTPRKGTPNWHVPLNDNFERLDTDVEIRDLRENRGEYTPKEGAKFLATDTDEVFIGDGERWARFDPNYTSVSAIVWRENPASGPIHGRHLETHTTFSSSDDLAPVVTNLVEEISAYSFDVQNDNQNGGTIMIRRGSYPVRTPAVIDAKGIEIRGESTGAQNVRNQGTLLRNDGLGSGESVVQISASPSSTGGYGTTLRALGVDCSGGDVVGIDVQKADRLTFEDVSSVRHGDRGLGLRLHGCYNSEFRYCNFWATRMEKSPETGDNVNNVRFHGCIFRTPDAGASFSPLRLEAGGNWLNHCIVNSLSVDDGIPAVGGTIQRWRFSQCNVYGDGQPLIDSPTRCTFVGGNINGEVTNPNRTSFVNVDWDVGERGAVYTDGTSGLAEVNISNCRFDRKGGSVPAINAASDANNEYLNGWTVIGNAVYNSGDGPDIALDRNVVGSNVIISGNVVPNGIAQEFGSALVGGGGTLKISENAGHNPVGTRRPTPDLPGSTGATVSNPYGEEVVVYQTDDASGTTVTDDRGRTSTFRVDPGTVVVPALGSIGYRDAVPSEWQWYWT
jgi:hypothetical protein